MAKTVCVIGAGPSGLVAAKTLLGDRRARGRFCVTIVECQTRVGGLWPTSPTDSAGLIHPLMVANQSRHTAQFSDLAWAAEDAGNAVDGQADVDDVVPQFPRAWQIGRYLERYHRHFLAGRDDCELQLGRRVVHAEPLDDARGWRVLTAAADATSSESFETVEAVYDYLVVASGYFGRAAVPKALRTTVEGAVEDSGIPVIHSSQYRSLSTLFARAPERAKGRILVVGGQFSGVELAATIANHVSSARYAPGKADTDVAASDDLCVHHLIQRPYWVIPLHTSPAPTAETAPPPFLPFDLTSYNVCRRAQPLVDTQGHISTEAARRAHAAFGTLLGTDQADVHPALAMRGDDVLDAPPYMAVSDAYLEHVRAGLIGVSRGRLEAVDAAAAAVTTSVGALDNLAAVVLATGFSAAASLAFFPAAVLERLQFDAADSRQTVVLALHNTHHAALPRLAFVGYYRSPYWGVMEMQARTAAALFVGDADPAAGRAGWPHLASALAADRSMERTLALRAHPSRNAQFPMGDYLYLMESFGRALGIPRTPGVTVSRDDVRMDVVTPSGYLDDGNDGNDKNDEDDEIEEIDTIDAIDSPAASEAQRALASTRATAAAGLLGSRFVARAVFRNLLGTWRLDRTLMSRLPSHPSGRFVGTAEFRLRAATADGRTASAFRADDPEDLEYLYVEDGTFTAAGGGPSFRATRRYVWRYNALSDQLSVWFARTDDHARADYLFHTLAFAAPPARPDDIDCPGVGPRPWTATAGHLCIDDFYDVHYTFDFAAVLLRSWQLRYTVRGPKKDYTIKGRYSR